ncbi:MAG: hybrid sensor histidine kinase/response regulator [Terriglobales bacterium]
MRDLDVLLIEDSEDDALLIARALQGAGFAPRPRRVDTEAALLAALPERDWEVVIADYRMPALAFDTALRRVREHDAEVPFLIVSGALGEEQAVSAMRSGAQDYVLKDRLVRLGAAVEREVREAQLRRQHRTAAEQAERERRHLEEQLRQAQKMEALGRLAGGIAHDFNNLLMVISGQVALLRNLPAAQNDPERLTRLNDVAATVDRAAALTRQLLAFGRRQVVRLQALDLDQTVATLENLLQRLIGEDVELLCTLNAPGSRIQADPHQIEQILMNLAINARDAMPQGGQLVFSTERLTRPAEPESGLVGGDYIRLQVHDTGHGMDEATASQIFEPFFTTKETGTGLGLSTVYGIVRQLRGDIRVASQPGQGATFTLELPCCAELRSMAPPRQPPARAGGETVLLLEDDDRVRLLLGDMLRSLGYRVLASASADDAIAAARSHPGPIHLLLADVILPRISGQQAARELLRLRPGLRLLYMSGHSDDALRNHGLESPPEAFLQKPFTPETLAVTIQAVLAA